MLILLPRNYEDHHVHANYPTTLLFEPNILACKLNLYICEQLQGRNPKETANSCLERSQHLTFHILCQIKHILTSHHITHSLHNKFSIVYNMESPKTSLWQYVIVEINNSSGTDVDSGFTFVLNLPAVSAPKKQKTQLHGKNSLNCASNFMRKSIPKHTTTSPSIKTPTVSFQ